MDEVTPEMRLARRIAAQALRDRKMPSPSYEAIDVAAGKYDEHSAVQAALAAIKETSEAQRPQPSGDEIERVVRALCQARDDLLAVGNDYPGSSCQKWCTERAAAAWSVLQPWRHCPSTHCERAQECRSINECSANNAALAAMDREPVAQPTRSASDE